MSRCAALLRGINVGGRSKVAMDDFRRVFVDLGYTDARTYIQTGNVVFTAVDEQPSQLAAGIEERIAADLGLDVDVLLRTEEELAHVISANPFMGSGADTSKLHVTFLAEEPGDQRGAGLESPPGETDELRLIGREVYLHCPNGYGRTKLNNAFIEKRLGVAATTRTWKTVVKLRDLTSGYDGPAGKGHPPTAQMRLWMRRSFTWTGPGNSFTTSSSTSPKLSKSSNDSQTSTTMYPPSVSKQTWLRRPGWLRSRPPAASRLRS